MFWDTVMPIRIFSYHHYHTKAWELLLCIRGEASVQIGGASGPKVTISTGDLALIPPGVAHKQLNEKNGFALLGSYPTFGGFDGDIDTLTGCPTTEVGNGYIHVMFQRRIPFFVWMCKSYVKRLSYKLRGKILLSMQQPDNNTQNG